ncbi:MAG: DUF3857 domain-containing transglutaminase family protein [Paracoccaceae bacterium]
MRLFTALIFWCLAAATAQAGDFTRQDAPDWVEMLAIPDMRAELKAESYDGLAYVLDDTQVSFDGETKQTFHRDVTEVTSRDGLEQAATIQQDYDPELEEVVLTHLDLIRAGQVTHLRDRLKEDVFRRETDLEDGIIDGTLTVHLQVPDVRVGDRVDYGFLVRRKPPVPGADRGDRVRLEFSVPVALTRYVLHWPKGWGLTVQPLPDRVLHSQTPEPAAVRHEWRRVDHLPFPDEDDTPYGYRREAILDYGPWDSWQPLVAALSPYYTADYPLPHAWQAKLDAIRAREPWASGRAIAALRLVQDDIRYVGLEMGVGGYYARTPAEVAESGYGDCKDKALLLVATLKALGITGHVALANLDHGLALPRQTPAIGAFDHMIVRVEMAGRRYWMDPTAIHEAGTLETATTPDFGYALALDGSAAGDLEPLEPTDAMRWTVDTDESFDFGQLGLYLTVLTRFDGEAANAQRRHWASTPVQGIARAYLSYYARSYPGLIQALNPTMQDDPAANQVEVREYYFLPRFALDQGGLRTDFTFAADLGHLIDVTVVGRRETPLDIGAPKLLRHHVKVRNAPIDFRPPDPATIDNDAFFYDFSGNAPKSGDMNLDWVYRTKERVLPADRVVPVVADSRRVGDTSSWTWDLTPDAAPTNN